MVKTIQKMFHHEFFIQRPKHVNIFLDYLILVVMSFANQYLTIHCGAMGTKGETNNDVVKKSKFKNPVNSYNFKSSFKYKNQARTYNFQTFFIFYIKKKLLLSRKKVNCNRYNEFGYK